MTMATGQILWCGTLQKCVYCTSHGRFLPKLQSPNLSAWLCDRIGQIVVMQLQQ